MQPNDRVIEPPLTQDSTVTGAVTQGPDPALNGHQPDEHAPPWLQDIPKEYRPEAVLTDTANAWRFAQACAGRVRYVEQWGRWLVWDGRRWAEDHEGRVLHYAREAAASIYGEAQDVASRDKSYAVRLAEWAKSSQSDHGLRAMLHQGESWPGIAATPEQFDNHPWLLNCRNGVLDLRTGTLGPHDPALLLTKLVDIGYDPAAKLPRRFLRFLLEIFRHNKRLVRFLQRAIGYSLVADVSGECFLIFYGTGQNGKSTLILVLRDLLGDYAINVRPEVLAVQRFQSGGAPTPDIARLRGMRLVTSVETAEGVWLNESLLKQFASREPMTARFLHRDPFDFPPTFLLVFSTNHKPNIRGTDQGIWRRTMLIPFERAFTEDEQDPDLISKLRAELAGILAWAVRGCLIWQRERLNAPPEVTAATAAYRAEMDVLGGFLAECCAESATDRVLNKDLYAGYQLWCEMNNEHPVKNREFCKRLEERGFAHERVGAGYEWRGLALRPEVLEELASAERRKSGKGGGGRFSDGSPKAADLPQRFQANDPSGPVAEIWRPCPTCGNSTLAPDFVCHVCIAGDGQQSPRSGQGEITPNYCPDCGGSPREGAHDYGDGPRCELHDRPLTHSARRGGV